MKSSYPIIGAAPHYDATFKLMHGGAGAWQFYAYEDVQKILFDSLESSLKRQLRIGDSIIKPAVVINADSLVSWGDIVRVMQVAKKLGATTSASVRGMK